MRPLRKGTLREFTPVGRDSAIFQDQGEGSTERFRGTVNLNFHDIFPRVGMGRFHVDGEPAVNDLQIVGDFSVIHHVWHSIFKGGQMIGLKHSVCNGSRVYAADADNADAPFAGRRGDSRNRCFFIHKTFSSIFTKFNFLYFYHRKRMETMEKGRNGITGYIQKLNSLKNQETKRPV
jgi:hypothetical protein